MKVEDWIKERRTIHGASTSISEAPWESQEEDWAVISSGPDSIFHAYADASPCPGCGEPDLNGEPQVAVEFDHERAIVDAHNTLPALLTALEKVLEEHPRQGLYEPCIPKYCCGEDIHEHIETDSGEWVHADDQVGWACFTCRTEDGESSDWPCPTVQAIEGAINE